MQSEPINADPTEDLNGTCKMATVNSNLFAICDTRQAHFDLVATMEPSPLSREEELENKLAQLDNEREDEMEAAVDVDAIIKLAKGKVLEDIRALYPEKVATAEGKTAVKRKRSKSAVRGVQYNEL
jgi:hypothetical protein